MKRLIASILLVLGFAAASTAQVTPLPNTLGEQKTLAILVNFSAGDEGYTTTDVSNVMAVASDYFYSNSFNQTWLNTLVTGWFTLPANLAFNCQRTEIANQAIAAAANIGIDVNQYTRYVVFHTFAQCGFDSFSEIGTFPSHSWISPAPIAFTNGSLNRVVPHELGHAFGLQHAGGTRCVALPFGPDCGFLATGDRFDIMGDTLADLATPNRTRLGWLTSAEIADVTASGSYPLVPHNSFNSGPHALRVTRENGTTFYIEYRVGLGVFVRVSPGDASVQYLVDATPEDFTYSLSHLAVGKTIYDQQFSHIVGITTVSQDSAGASVAIDLNAVIPPPPAPALTVVASLDKVTYRKGNTAKLRVTVTKDNIPIVNAAVAWTITKPNGTVVVKPAPKTNAAGFSELKFKVDAVGTWSFKATVTSCCLSAVSETLTVPVTP